ncbi:MULTISPECIES: IclR family transcriptional regulator [Actinopolyspora]|uniref:DNA-binding transcriptional regulator, IclR family n=1 Tax=Actinopolyspora saharensis TaxID=995062 RepID=A0A1H1FM05_9ACTN|nr:MULTISPECIES: IclR family transcriptional regulator [Actinopolyspora]NHD18892.1 IclR family transcriptional regulator [Actinopolyspora sp. BKK2]NHE77315.1 IclR family transcriptional regulator [Actinopolyspora sp. BKK1]SDR01910.1 DNA-binding transcriptional regulator, IclR family [Actinopolyspora saharensis]
MAGNSRESGRTVTGRAFSVLGAFDAESPRLSLTEISQRADVPLATAHRLVGELEAWGALRRESDGRYAIGLRLWELGLLAPVHTGLRNAAMPYMQQLHEQTGANVQLAVRDGPEAVYVEKLSGRRSIPILSRSGGRLPLHPTGVGKVLLAHAPREVVQDYCARGLARYTPYTVAEPGRLVRELAGVRQRDFARTAEEMTFGSCSVAVPVREEGEVVAALGLVVQTSQAEVAKLVRALVPAAEAVGRQLDGSTVFRSEAD